MNRQSNKEIEELKNRVDSLAESVKLLQKNTGRVSNENATATLQQQHVLLAMQHCLAQLSQQQRDVTKSQRQLTKLMSKEQHQPEKALPGKRIVNGGGDNTLHDTIYSEVATLISFNENRPHFLLDAIRLLQKLNSDFLRQRALYSLRDVIKDYVNISNKADIAESDRNSTPSYILENAGENNSVREDLNRRTNDYRVVKTAGFDTTALDTQVKSIMQEVMGAIRAHAYDVCTTEMLYYLVQVVLHAARKYSTSEAYSRTLEKQLGRVLKDSLEKYNNKSVQECKEELLLDVSELLFNELAFARLLHGIDESKKSQTALPDDDEDEESLTRGSTIDQDKLDSEAEAMARKRDDEMAAVTVTDLSSNEDDDDETKREVELSYIERKPVTHCSEEDEAEGADATAELSEESDTAVRRQQGEPDIDVDQAIAKKVDTPVANGKTSEENSSKPEDENESLQNPPIVN